jgi:hypothetical protein
MFYTTSVNNNTVADAHHCDADRCYGVLNTQNDLVCGS